MVRGLELPRHPISIQSLRGKLYPVFPANGRIIAALDRGTSHILCVTKANCKSNETDDSEHDINLVRLDAMQSR